ncbi:MAG: hypothetical protein KY448_06815 [Cyanobacteria bacterium 0813]|nr:hypothetical protein [Cyanobacteria bacterium 0813]
MPVLGGVRSLPSLLFKAECDRSHPPLKMAERNHSGLTHNTDITLKIFVDTHEPCRVVT